MYSLILASTCPARKMLMDTLNIPYRIMPSNYEEDIILPHEIHDHAMTLERGKAMDVASSLDEGIVIGIDLFVGFQGHHIGKPRDKTAACKTFAQLSGNTHEVYSGITPIDAATKREWVDYCVTSITFKDLTPQDINDYIATGEPMRRSGAYALQGKGRNLIKDFIGCQYNVMGLPLTKLREGLTIFDIEFS